MANDYQDPSQMLNTAQAAHFLGLHKCTLDRWRAQGKGPFFHQIGRAIRYSLSDLTSWQSQQRRSPGHKRPITDDPPTDSRVESGASPTDAKPAQQTPSPDSSRSR